jgi:hypothetical protein
MKGARELASVVDSGVYGKLRVVSSSHARGLTFHIYAYATPEDAEGGINGVEVYGVVSGHLGWTESYGWLRSGKWCDDFAKVFDEKKRELIREVEELTSTAIAKQQAEQERIEKILAAY